MSPVLPDKASVIPDRSRAPRRGSARFPGSPRTPSALAVVVAAAVAVVVVILVTAGGDVKPVARYGGLPSWLPKTAAPTDHVVTATAAHPKLAVEGDTVRVELGHGRADTTIVGPQVPESGRSPVPATSPCSFTVTLTRVSGRVPLRASDFTIVAENSYLYHPRVSGPHRRPVPTVVRPGQTVVLNIKAVLPTGAGQVRWTPEAGAPISSWDFDVEID